MLPSRCTPVAGSLPTSSTAETAFTTAWWFIRILMEKGLSEERARVLLIAVGTGFRGWASSERAPAAS